MHARTPFRALSLSLAPLLWSCAGTTVASIPPEHAFPKDGDARAYTEQASSLPAAIPQELPASLNLEQAAALVMERNPQFDLAAAHLAKAESEIAASRVAFRPKVGLNLEYLRADAPSLFLFKTIDARGFVPGTDFNQPGSFGNWEAGLSFGYNLYAGGQSKLQTRIAELQRELQLADTSALRNHLLAATYRLWFEIQGAEFMVQTAESSLRTVSAQHEEMKLRFEEGTVLKADLLSLDARLASTEADLIAARHAAYSGKVALASLMGLPFGSLPALELQQETAIHYPQTTSLETALADALRQRSELEVLRLQLAQAGLRVEQANGSNRPQVDVFGQVWADNPELSFDGSDANWAVGIALSWDLFDGGATEARGARAQAERLAVKAMDRQAWLQVQAEVEQAHSNLGDALAQQEAAHRGQQASEESFRLVQVQFEEGLANITRYLEAEQMLTDARYRVTMAQIAEQQARIDFMQATGSMQQLASHGEDVR